MKRLFHLLLIFIILLSATELYATDLDDLLRGLDSPEVDYHVDEEIKTIVIPPKPVIKAPEKPSEPVSPKKEDTSKESQASSKEKKEAVSNSKNSTSAKATDEKNKITASDSSKVKSSLSDLAQKLKKDKESKKLANNKPIKIYSLFTFFKNMAFVQTWQNNITNNLAFCKLLTEDVFDFWQQKVYEEAEEEAAAEEEEEEEEEEAPIDFSKYAEQLAQAKTLCDEGKWDEVNKIFEENPEAAEAPEAQKYLLLVELNNPKMNVNRLRSLGNSVIETEPNDPYANYALAIYHFKSKKKDVKKASQHIAIALKDKNPPKGALELSKEINSSGFAIYIIIGLLIIAIAGVVFIIIKKKAKQETPTETASTENETPKDGNKLAQKLEPIKAKLEPILKKLEPILAKAKPLFEKLKAAILNAISKLKKKKQVDINLSDLPANKPSQAEEEVEEIVVEVDEDGNEIIVEEVEDDGSGSDVTEEIIEEEILEGSDSSSNQEIVEEHIIEEIEEDDDSEEEIVEEIVEEEEGSEEIEDKGTSEISEESLLKE